MAVSCRAGRRTGSSVGLRRQLAVGVLVAGGLLSGCTASGGPSTAGAATSSAATEGSDPAPTSPSPSASPGQGDPGQAPVLTLEGDGLGLLAADDSDAPLPFGSTTGAALRQVVEDALGQADEEQLPACPQGPRTALRVDGFTVLLDGDSFVGWTDLGAPDRTLTTAEGVGAGSTLADLQSAVPGAVVGQDPSGGATFASPGGLSGTLTGPEPTATVSALSAGQTCPGS